MYTQQITTTSKRRIQLKRAPSFGSLLDEWLDSRTDIKPTTRAVYRGISEKHIRPRLGNIPVNRLGNAELAGFMDDLSAQNVPANTAEGIVNVLRQAVRFAEKRGCRADPGLCRWSKKAPKRQVDVLTASEQQTLLETLGERPSGLDLGILLALKTGLRVGEVCALRWEDVLFAEGQLHIQRTVQRIAEPGGGTRLYIGDPKSSDSDRKIPLTPALLALLSERRGEGYILSSGHERPAEPRTLQRRFKLVLSRAGLRDVNFHVLRHSFATKCVERGFDIKSLSMILGHASVSTTMNIYVHPSTERLRSMMMLLDD